MNVTFLVHPSADVGLRSKLVVLCLLGAFAAMASLTCEAQLYETPETRRQQAEALRQEQEQKKREATAKRSAPPNLEQKRAEAEEYIGKTFWYLPNPNARKRVRFYEKVPPSSHSQDPNFLFTPLTITSFVVTGAIMPPPIVYAEGRDEYLLEIRFPDGRVGYLNVVGCCGVVENLYSGRLSDNYEYLSTEPAQDVLARESRLRAEEQLAKEREAREYQAAKEKAARDEQLARETTARAEQAARARAAKERTSREAMPPPRIGMTRQQVVNDTRWGRPDDINRTTTARGVREQWVYGSRRYLYFENGVLTAIQD